MYHNFCIHGHLGCFHTLVIINSPAMNIGVHVSFSIMVSSGYMPCGETIGSYGSFIPFFFNESPYCSPQWMYQFTFPPTVKEDSLYSTASPAFIICRFFDDGDCDWLPQELDSKESTCSTGDAGSIPGSGRSPGGGHGNPFQYS